MSDWFAHLQKLVPQHGLSRLVGAIAQSEQPWIKRLFIEQFARVYGVSLAEAQAEHFADYKNFNDFFTRALKPDARPLPGDTSIIVSPADGAVSQMGPISRGQL